MSAATPAPVDPREFKAVQREAWGAAAEGWKTWWRVFERSAQGLNERIVELAGVRPGSRVLDVATGIGEPAITAARRTGPSGSVVATDLAPPMIALARDRAVSLGLSNVEFREMDAESLDLAGESFDAATCRWGLMLFQDPLGAARGVRHALRAGARFAAAVWGPPERVPFLAIPHVVASRELQVPAPPPNAPGAFSLAADGALEKVFHGAGFREVEAETLEVVFEFASPREYATFLGDLSATLRKALEVQSEAVRDRVWREVERESERHLLPGGCVRLTNEVRCVSGSR